MTLSIGKIREGLNIKKLMFWIALVGLSASVIMPFFEQAKQTIDDSGLNELQTQQVCLASISTMFSKPLDIIKVTHVKYDIVYMEYVRAEDNTTWKYKCYLNGKRVVWGSVGNDASGRWRTNIHDPVVTWKISGSRLIITDAISDTTKNIKEFKI